MTPAFLDTVGVLALLEPSAKGAALTIRGWALKPRSNGDADFFPAPDQI